MNHTGYFTSQEFMFQISSQSVKPFDLEVDEHRDIEPQNIAIRSIFILERRTGRIDERQPKDNEKNTIIGKSFLSS